MDQWFSNDSHEARAYAQVTQAEGHHKAHLSHELIAAAASYEAMKAYHKHCEKNGQPASHAQAKEILAGLSGAFIDRMVETKGLDFIDREKAKHHAHEQLHRASERDFYDRRDGRDGFREDRFERGFGGDRFERDGFGERRDGFGEHRDGFGERRDGFGEHRDGFGEHRDGFGEHHRDGHHEHDRHHRG